MLPQGWRWSPLLFRTGMEFILAAARQELDSLHAIPPIKFHVAAMQDDIIAGTSSYEHGLLLYDVLVRQLEHFSFQINHKKSLKLVRSLNFCGYKISHCFITPDATRTQINLAFAEQMLTLFKTLKTTEQRRTWLQKLTGHFAFVRSFLSADMLPKLQYFYDATKSLTLDPDIVLSTNEIQDALYDLVTYMQNGVQPAILAKFSAILAPIVVSDANVESYAIQLFYLVDLPTEVSIELLPDLRAVQEVFTKIAGFPVLPVTNRTILIPVRNVAGLFSLQEQKASSTYRERLAQLTAVGELHALFQGVTIFIGDNRPTSQHWHDIEANFTGRRLQQFLLLQEHVHYQVWCSRDGVPSLADTMARAAILTRSKFNEVTQFTQNEPLDSSVTIRGAASVLEIRDPSASLAVIELDADFRDTSLVTEVLITPFANAIRKSFLLDSQTSFQHVLMSDVYRALTEPTTASRRAKKLASQHFCLKDGLLIYVTGLTAQYYVPEFLTDSLFPILGKISSRTALVHFYHNAFGIHKGVDRVKEQLYRFFWWPSMGHTVQQLIKACDTCRIVKMKALTTQGPQGSTSFRISEPRKQWIIDYADLPVIKKNMLVAICSYSHFVVASITHRKDALTAANFLVEHIIYKFGPPASIHSDQGTHFLNGLFDELKRQTQIEFQTGPTYWPRAQGLVEKTNGELKTAILSCTRSSKLTHEQALNLAVFVHNTSKHAKLAFSPYEIFYGSPPEPFTPVDVSSLLGRDLVPIPERQRLANELYQMKRADHHASVEAQANLSNRKCNFKVNDLVHVVQKPQGKPIQQSGPFLIVEVKNNSVNLTVEVWSEGQVFDSTRHKTRLVALIISSAVLLISVVDFRSYHTPVAPPFTGATTHIYTNKIHDPLFIS